MGYLDKNIEKNRHKKSSFSRTLVRVLEVMAIVLGFLANSRIARFLSAKVTMDVLVEVSVRFGAPTGHFLSTVIAAVIAEPLIIAYGITGVIIAGNLIVFLIKSLRKRK